MYQYVYNFTIIISCYTNCRCDALSTATADTDAVFVHSHNKTIGVFLKDDPMKVYPSTLDTWMKIAGIQGFPGFSLSIFDIPDTAVSILNDVQLQFMT